MSSQRSSAHGLQALWFRNLVYNDATRHCYMTLTDHSPRCVKRYKGQCA